MKLNKALGWLLAALLCAALNGALAEPDIAMEDAGLDMPVLEDVALPDLDLGDALAPEEGLPLEAIQLPQPGEPAFPVPATEANDGDEQEEIVLMEGTVYDERGEAVETYQYFDYGFVEGYGWRRYRFRVLDGGSVRIIGYEYFPTDEGIVTIPAEAGPYRVTEIGEGLLAGYPNIIHTVTIPDTVKAIGAGAFAGLRGLKNLAIPDSVAFIGPEAFSGCDAMASVSIPGSVKAIEGRAFYKCARLESVSLAEGVASIGEEAFRGCAALKAIAFPTSLTRIDRRAFYKCGGLTRVEVPLTVAELGEGAFGECKSLAELTIDPKLFKAASAGYANRVVIPSGVTSIPDGAFSGHGTLSDVVIPKTVASIGAKAFSDCGALAGIAIPAGVTDIGEQAFRNCASLKTLTLSKNLKSIGVEAFRGCVRLTTVRVPAGVESIGKRCFYECSGLKRLVIDRSTRVGTDFVTDSEKLSIKTCYKSYAEKYARKHGIRVVYTDAPTQVSLNKTGTVKLRMYKTLKLKAKLAPKGCAPYLSWKSSDGKVAGVTQKGLVSAVKLGTAKISVYDANGKKRASVEIRVIAPKPAAVTISGPKSIAMSPGETLDLEASVEPVEAEAKLTWTSSKPMVASVNRKGRVKALKAGKTVITVKTSNGKTDTVTVKVKAPKK